MQNFKSDEERNQYLDEIREAMGLPKPEGPPMTREELIANLMKSSRPIIKCELEKPDHL